MVKKQRANWGGYALILLMLVTLAVMVRNMGQTKESQKYSEILTMFEEQQVTEFALDLGTGDLNMRVEGTEEITSYKVPDVSLFVMSVQPYIEAYAQAHPDAPMVYDYKPAATTPWWASLIPTVLLLVALGAFWFYMYSQQGGGKAMQVGRAKVKDQNESGRKATFADVAGADEEKAELSELVEFLRNPHKFNQLGARIPRGVLLVGPPGTGKTLLARSVAGEAGVPFYSISGSDFVEMYVGVGASRVRDLFDKARKTSPCIVFIDEIDAVGRQRGAGLGGGHDEREQTLNQLLVEMDGFGDHQGVIIIAATNRADILDRALLRPGRFDRQIYVGLPDIRGREAILKVHMRGKPCGPDVNLSTVARATPGFSGADLENLVNEAALSAARAGRKAIVQADIEEASIKVIAGPEKKSRVMSDRERRLTAYHEAGHAITTFFVETATPVHEISIIPRGQAGGYTLSLPEDDTNYRTKKEMLGELETLLGGRVAEQLVMGDISTGASNDLERATSIAKNMVMRYGFSERLGPVVYGQDERETFLGRDFSQGRGYSEAVASEIDEEIRAMIEKAYKRTETVLSEHIDKLHEVAGQLLAREKLSGAQFAAVMKGKPLADDKPAPKAALPAPTPAPAPEQATEPAPVQPDPALAEKPAEPSEKE